ncbi:putative transcriptional regulator, MerR family [Novosphingobium sp. Rr 2-17]|uniref:MerR family transcriptional regulator n=1 Tax=Novosphingobium sp. Rr 2-17 TaxID=555793 RepID=UPI000269AAC5|nr:MerR family transcriptional regulator [Novosphingobium sp. Rr 2-17]EIZ81363.1 putative transcriptional regulator, MerR family [Novosphingobium sp. Rr 2-17]
MNALTISKLAKQGDVGVETVRYYQRRGLLNEPSRAAGIRHYGDEDVRRLRFIRAAQAAGFTLEEISVLLNLDAVDDRKQAREMAETRIAILDVKIAEMQAARAALSRLAMDCEKSKAQACPIISAFEL